MLDISFIEEGYKAIYHHATTKKSRASGETAQEQLVYNIRIMNLSVELVGYTRIHNKYY